MNDLLAHPAPGRGQPPAAAGNSTGSGVGTSAQAGAPLLEVLWRRRWTVALTMTLCVVGAAVYLALATRVYRSTASLVVGDSTRFAAIDERRQTPHPENFIETQRDVLQSYAVLSRAVGTLNVKDMKTFANVSDPAAWLRSGTRLRRRAGQQGRRARGHHGRALPAGGGGRSQRDRPGLRRRALRSPQVRRRGSRPGAEEAAGTVEESVGRGVAGDDAGAEAQGVLSFRTNDTGNVVAERASALSSAFTSAQIAAVELRRSATPSKRPCPTRRPPPPSSTRCSPGITRAATASTTSCVTS